jgi:hypothetical protein
MADEIAVFLPRSGQWLSDKDLAGLDEFPDIDVARWIDSQVAAR